LEPAATRSHGSDGLSLIKKKKKRLEQRCFEEFFSRKIKLNFNYDVCRLIGGIKSTLN
jgi:hypothetical protein